MLCFVISGLGNLNKAKPRWPKRIGRSRIWYEALNEGTESGIGENEWVESALTPLASAS